MTLSRASRRELILSWVAIGLGWIAVIGIGFALRPEWLIVLVPAATICAAGLATLATKRARAHRPRASITIEDLRAQRSSHHRAVRR